MPIRLIPVDEESEAPTTLTDTAGGASGSRLTLTPLEAPRSALARPEPARTGPLPPTLPATPVQRTEEAMSDVELALRGDPEMGPTSWLATPEGRRVATRLPGNIKKSIGAQATEMVSGLEEFVADADAEAYQQDLDVLLSRDEGFLPKADRRALEASLKGRVASKLEAGRVAAGRTAAAREGAAEAIPADASMAERAVQQGLSSAAISAPAILIAGPVGGASILGTGAAAARRSELLAAGVPEADANRSALLLGSLEGLTEFIPGTTLVRRIPGFGKHVAQFLLTEIPGENINTIAQMVDDYALEMREDVTLDDLLEAMKETTAATIVGGTAQVAVANAMQGAAEIANARAAERAGEAAPPGPPGSPTFGPGAVSRTPEAAAPAPPTHSRLEGEVRQPAREKIEPTIGELPEVRSRMAPSIGSTVVTANEQENQREGLPERARVAAETAGQATPEAPAVDQGKSAPSRGDGDDGGVAFARRETLTALQAVRDGQASPDQVARLEAQKLVIRGETNKPRLLPAGRRRLTELAKPDTVAAEKPAETTPTPPGKPQPATNVGRAAQVPTSVEERKAAGEAAIARVEAFGRELEAARAATNPAPTREQAKAGNYAKGTLSFAGLKVALENPKGSTRKGYDEKGNETWSREMKADYGYIQRTQGKDGDELDVFLTGAPDTGRIFVVNQHVPESGVFDEHKAILGAHTKNEAEKLYLSHYPKGWKGLGQIVEMSTDDFQQWVKSGDLKRPARPTQRVVRAYQLEEGRTYVGERVTDDEAVEVDLTFEKPLELRHGFSRRARENLRGHLVGVALPQRGNDVAALLKGPHREKLLTAIKAAGYDGAVYLEGGKERYIATGAKVEKIERKEKPKLSPTLAAAKPGPAPKFAPMRPKFSRRKGGTGLTAEDRERNRLDANASELIAQIAEESRTEDFSVKEAVDAVRMWAEQEKHDIGAFRDAVLNAAKRFTFGRAGRAKIEQAIAKISAETPAIPEVPKPAAEASAAAKLLEWFGKSQIVNEDGSPRRMYHGTSRDFTVFDFSLGGAVWDTSDSRGVMWFTSHEGRANAAARDAAAVTAPTDEAYEALVGANVLPVYLRVTNPLHLRGKLLQPDEMARQIESAKAAGHDGIIMDGEMGGIDVAVFEPIQVKSAIGNRGTYDPRNPDIRFARRPTFYSSAIRAAESIEQQRATGTQWWNTTQNKPGVKQDELAWMGLKEWLTAQGDRKIPKAEVLDFMRANEIQIQEKTLTATTESAARSELNAAAEWFRSRGWSVWFDQDDEGALDRIVSPEGVEYWGEIEVTQKDSYGNEQLGLSQIPDREFRVRAVSLRDMARKDYKQAGGAQYGEYTLPGGQNYRELMLILPPRETPPGELPPGYEFITDRGMWGTVPEGQAHARTLTGLHSTREFAAQALREYLKGSVIFRSQHFDEPNILAHVRLTDHTDADGKAVLLVEEVQSDWHQKGRRYGYRDPLKVNDIEQMRRELIAVRKQVDELLQKEGRLGFDDVSEARNALLTHKDWKTRFGIPGKYWPTIDSWLEKNRGFREAERGFQRTVPEAPFKTTWLELAMKRVIRMAAENGYERIAWTTGEQQVERYDLAQVIERVEWYEPDLGPGQTREKPIRTVNLRTAWGSDMSLDVDLKTGVITATDSLDDDRLTGEELKSVVGEHLAQKILSKPDGTAVAEPGTTVGGEGMREFYDNILPRTLGKYIKKWGAKVTKTQLPGGYYWMKGGQRMGPYPESEHGRQLAESDAAENNATVKVDTKTVHAFDVTPQMTASALEGQPLFARRTTPIEQWEVTAFADDLKAQLGLEVLDLRAKPNGDVDLETIVVPKSGRGMGTGTAALNRIIQWADSRQARLTLRLAEKGFYSSAEEGDRGTTSPARLERFYRRFGFVPNRGRRHRPELSINTSMYREPREPKFARAADFRKWFGRSKVTDAKGEPLRVYHGTNQAIQEFDLERRGMATTAWSAKRGFYFTADPAIASEYAQNAGQRVIADIARFERETARLKAEAERLERVAQRTGAWDAAYRAMEAWEAFEIEGIRADTLEGQNIFPAYLKIENPLVYDFEGRQPGLPGGKDETLQGLIDRAIEEGRDGVIMRNLLDSPQMTAPSEQFIVFSPDQVRSAITLKRARPTAPARGMAMSEVSRVVRQVLEPFSRVPAVSVVASYRQLPPALRQQLERENATETTGAIFIPGVRGDSIVIIAENNATELEVIENLYHELVGHYGLRQIMDDARYDEVMDGIWRDMPERVREAARRNALDVSDIDQRRVAAEEVIAYAAGQQLSGQPIEGAVRTWWKKILEAVRAFFQRALGRERFNDAAIARVVAAAKKALEGQQAGVHKSLRQGVLRHQRPPLYYSQLFAAINDPRVPNTAPPAEYVKIIRSKVGKEVKPEEMEWSGILDFLESVTWSDIIERRAGDVPNLSMPEELRARAETYQKAATWEREHGRADRSSYSDSVAIINRRLEQAIEAAKAIGFHPRQDVIEYTGENRQDMAPRDFLQLQLRFASVRNQIQIEMRNILNGSVLDVQPKRIPKSVLLDFINQEQIQIDIVPSREDEADVEWINTRGREPQVDDPDPSWIEEQVKEALTEEAIDERVRALIEEDPGAWLDDEDSDAIVDENDNYDTSRITDEMIERARENSNLIEEARHRIELAVKSDAWETHHEDPPLTYFLQDERRGATVEIHGQDSAQWFGTIVAPNGLTHTVDDEDLEGVEAQLREWGRVNLPKTISTKYRNYTVPGGADYGETLFVWANPRDHIGTYENSHWDPADVLLHVRYDTREGPKGEKILFLDEIQSDWHQEVRDQVDVSEFDVQILNRHEDLLYQYRTRFRDGGAIGSRFPSPQATIHAWLEGLALKPEDFRRLMIESKKHTTARGQEFAYVYEWLAERTGRERTLLRAPATSGVSPALDADPLMSLSLEDFNWTDFVTWLKARDEAHAARIRDSDTQAVLRFISDEATVGGGYASTPPTGVIPPSVRTTQSFLDYMEHAVPLYKHAPDGTDASIDEGYTFFNDSVLISHWEQGHITEDLATNDAGREALRSIAHLREPMVREIRAIGFDTPPQMGEFLRETGLSYQDAAREVRQKLITFAQNSTVARITPDFEKVVSDAFLEIKEAGMGFVRAWQQKVGAPTPKRAPPLAKTWPLAALKWALRHAAEHGFDQIALSAGPIHGTRWGATTSYERVNLYPTTVGDAQESAARTNAPWIFDPALQRAAPETPVVQLRLFKRGDIDSIDIVTTPERMAGWIGREAADALAQQKGQVGKDGVQRLSTLAHGVSTIWGPNADSRLRDKLDRVARIHHGMIETYNSILPFMFNKFLGKYGAKLRPGKVTLPKEVLKDRTTGLHEGIPYVGSYGLQVTIEGGAPITELPVVELNQKLKDAAINKGFPLFARRWVHGARALGNAVNNGQNTFTAPQPSLTSRFWNYLVYKAQDKFIDLFRTQKAVQAWRGATGIPDDLDAYLQQTLYHGRVEQRVAEYEKTYVEPLVKMIKDSGYDWSEVEEYLYARHAPEANARIAAINPGQPQYHSGMTDADAAAIMTRFAGSANWGKLVAIGQHVDAMTKFSRDMMVMEGLEDPAVVQAWEQTYQFYVPLKGWAGLDIDTEMPKRGRGFDVGGKLTKMRTGRTSRAATILANIVAQAQSTIILAEKAKVGRALYDFVSTTPAPDLWVVDEVEYMRYVDPSSGLVREGINPSFRLADNVLRVRRNGKDYHITFNPENEMMVRLAAAMKNLSSDQIGPIFSMLHGINRWLSALNTSLNPEFVITNALRDIQTAMATITEQQKKGIRRKILRDWRKAWVGIRQGEGQPLSGAPGQWAQHWLQFKRAGGKVGWIDHYKTPQDLERKLRRHLTPDNVLTYTVKGLLAVNDFINNENLAVENAVRLATFVNLKAAGLTEERAAEAAKNLTVNFNKKGEIGTVMNSLYLFYNASIQGSARLWALAKHPKGRLVLGTFFAAGLAMDILMRAIAGDDEDRENLYDKIPEHEKERNIIIVPPKHLRWKTPAGEDAYIKIMLPYGFSAIYYSGLTTGKYFDYGFLGNVRRVDPGADAARVAGAYLGSFSPIGDADGGLSQFLLPTLADPFVQLADNRAWWGGNIMPEDFDEDAPSPDSTRFYRSVPTPYRDAAAWLNAQTGGTEVSPGYIDVSPETLQHWMEFATGGAGRFGASVMNLPEAITNPEGLEIQEIPFWRKVVGGIGDRQTQETFYAHLTEVKYAKREIDAIYKIGITTEEGQQRLQYVANRYPVAVKMLREAYPNFATDRTPEELDKSRILRNLRATIEPQGPLNAEPRGRPGQRRAITSTLSDARKEIRRLEARPDMPAQERRQRIAEQEQLIRDTLIEFNRRWNEIEDSTRGERHQGRLIEKLGPLIGGKSTREQVGALRQAGYPATADLLAALPSTPDRFAREFFEIEVAREEPS